MKANMGCGDKVLPGYENFDKYPATKEVEFLDLEHIPYAIPNDYFQCIRTHHVLEHLNQNPYLVLQEFHRITKQGGMVNVRLPIFGNLVSHNRHLHSRNYMNPVTQRTRDNEYIRNLFIQQGFRRCERCSIRKILWKIKTRFITWVDSFLYDSYEWDLEVVK